MCPFGGMSQQRGGACWGAIALDSTHLAPWPLHASAPGCLGTEMWDVGPDTLEICVESEERRWHCCCLCGWCVGGFGADRVLTGCWLWWCGNGGKGWWLDADEG
eukprot:6007971-Ditylum_brightwellii.AAC.1